MRIHKGVGVLLVVGLTMVIALAATWVPERLSGMEAFHVRTVELEGARFLELDDATELMAIPRDASVWDDPSAFADRLRRHPLVREARVRRRLPGTLVVEVVEREPVALLPTPVLTPIDREGRLLPVDPGAHRLDLPILQPVREPWGERTALTPAEIRLLAGEVGRLADTEPASLAMISELAADRGGDVLIRLGNPAAILHYRPPMPPGRLRQGLRVLSDARERRPDEVPEVVDLRFDDQVVVRFRHPNRR